MRERARELVAGIEILAHLLGPERVLIGIEDNKPEAIGAVSEAVAGTPFMVVSVPTLYPSGGEKQLIQILTGLEVPSGGLPADIGVLCQNVGTCVAVHDAVLLGRPLISRITTLTGEALQRPMNVEALVGTPIKDLLAFAGLDERRLGRLLVGGPMMGFSLADAAAPVIKTSNCLLAATPEELPAPPPAMPCIRCGDCAEACPASLLPQQLLFYAQGEDHEQLQAHNLFDCIECGACAYVCPSSIPLVQYYRAAKADIRDLEQKQQKGRTLTTALRAAPGTPAQGRGAERSRAQSTCGESRTRQGRTGRYTGRRRSGTGPGAKTGPERRAEAAEDRGEHGSDRAAQSRETTGRTCDRRARGPGSAVAGGRRRSPASAGCGAAGPACRERRYRRQEGQDRSSHAQGTDPQAREAGRPNADQQAELARLREQLEQAERAVASAALRRLRHPPCRTMP